MPLLSESKTCYAGTQPITKIYAGTQQVWPKGSPLPKIPAMTQCYYKQPPSDPAPHDALLPPDIKGDNSKKFQRIVNGITIEDISVRYAITDGRPSESDWVLKTFPYRNKPNSLSGYQTFQIYADAIENQETEKETAAVDLGGMFRDVNRQKLYMQTSYAAAGYLPVWIDVAGTQSKPLQNGMPYPGTAYYKTFTGSGLLSYVPMFPVEIPELKLWVGSNPPVGGTIPSISSRIKLFKTPSREEVRLLSAIYYGFEEAFLTDGTPQKIYKYELQSHESYINTAPEQTYQYVIETVQEPVMTSEVATASLPSQTF